MSQLICLQSSLSQLQTLPPLKQSGTSTGTRSLPVAAEVSSQLIAFITSSVIQMPLSCANKSGGTCELWFVLMRHTGMPTPLFLKAILSRNIQQSCDFWGSRSLKYFPFKIFFLMHIAKEICIAFVCSNSTLQSTSLLSTGEPFKLFYSPLQGCLKNTAKMCYVNMLSLNKHILN